MLSFWVYLIAIVTIINFQYKLVVHYYKDNVKLITIYKKYKEVLRKSKTLYITFSFVTFCIGLCMAFGYFYLTFWLSDVLPIEKIFPFNVLF